MCDKSGSRSSKVGRTEVKEEIFSIGPLKSVIKETFSRTIQNDRVTAQQQFAYKCADLLHEIQHDSVGKIRSDKHFCEVTVNEYTLTCQVPRKGEVKTKLKVIFVETSSLAEEASEQRISRLLNNLSKHEYPDEWRELLQYWIKFTSSFRRRGFSNMKLIFCGQNGERVKIHCGSVKTAIMVFVNNKNYEEILFRVDEINKRTLGRIIISLCGNEGAEQTTEQAGLRRLLQAFITKIEGEKIKCFNDVKLSLYGKDSMSFNILAGKSHDPKQIVGYVDSKGEFHINEKQTGYCTIT